MIHEPAIVWWAALVECRICTNRHAMVIPAREGEPCPVNTECPNCGAMACDPVEDDE